MPHLLQIDRVFFVEILISPRIQVCKQLAPRVTAAGVTDGISRWSQVKFQRSHDDPNELDEVHSPLEKPNVHFYSMNFVPAHFY
mmetsp:Transcript_16293/g.26511  ORF Transcript_16293/g.26511 Transcript_16293/m.26511 type:complete len:84 (+) Transcript_16293:1190-1441(+)